MQSKPRTGRTNNEILFGGFIDRNRYKKRQKLKTSVSYIFIFLPKVQNYYGSISVESLSLLLFLFLYLSILRCLVRVSRSPVSGFGHL